MFATSSADRAGLLVAVITGGRPTLQARPTSRFLDECRTAGVEDVVWVMSEHHAESYERDGNPVVTYAEGWAYRYASEHWMTPDRAPERGGFLGAFAGREWACREAERRGCWGVLQLDDNIVERYWHRQTRGGKTVIDELGGYAFIVDALVGLALSTNAWMIAPALGSVGSHEARVIRTGFPYSSFVERVGAGREEWFGPFEDDITHALQYGDRADGATAAIAPMFRYQKRSNVRGKSVDLSGMRSQYGNERSRMLQRLNPHSARVTVKSKTSNGRGDPRVFHHMTAGAIRNPVVVKDPALFGRVADRFIEAEERYKVAEVEGNRLKARLRLEAHLAKGVAGAGGAA